MCICWLRPIWSNFHFLLEMQKTWNAAFGRRLPAGKSRSTCILHVMTCHDRQHWHLFWWGIFSFKTASWREISGRRFGGLQKVVFQMVTSSKSCLTSNSAKSLLAILARAHIPSKFWKQHFSPRHLLMERNFDDDGDDDDDDDLQKANVRIVFCQMAHGSKIKGVILESFITDQVGNCGVFPPWLRSWWFTRQERVELIDPATIENPTTVVSSLKLHGTCCSQVS